MSSGCEESVDLAARLLAEAQSVFVITGAGISAESGIPTFRDLGGLWTEFNPMELASPEGFARDPGKVWRWYHKRIDQARSRHPNPAHFAVAAIEKNASRFMLATQNVDRLHQRAGSCNVVEIHGNLFETRCSRTGRIFAEGEMDTRAVVPAPSPDGGLLRPNVVWFGECIDSTVFNRVENFLQATPPDVALAVGTTGMFPYIQRWAYVAKSLGARLCEINPEPSELSRICDIRLRGKAGETLPKLLVRRP
jgi:NAD-dependent deacetylase